MVCRSPRLQCGRASVGSEDHGNILGRTRGVDIDRADVVRVMSCASERGKDVYAGVGPRDRL